MVAGPCRSFSPRFGSPESWPNRASQEAFGGFLRKAFLVAFLGLGATLLAQEKPVVDGPGAVFQDDLISRLEGSWDITRRIRGTEVQTSMQAGWVLNHQFLQMHMGGATGKPAYEAIVLIGYIHSSRQYVAHWCDTYGGKFSAIGKGTRVGDSIEFRFEYPDGPFFNTFTWSPEEKTWVMRGESQDSAGKRKLFAIDTLRRAKQAPVGPGQ